MRTSTTISTGETYKRQLVTMDPGPNHYGSGVFALGYQPPKGFEQQLMPATTSPCDDESFRGMRRAIDSLVFF